MKKFILAALIGLMLIGGAGGNNSASDELQPGPYNNNPIEDDIV